MIPLDRLTKKERAINALVVPHRAKPADTLFLFFFCFLFFLPFFLDNSIKLPLKELHFYPVFHSLNRALPSHFSNTLLRGRNSAEGRSTVWSREVESRSIVAPFIVSKVVSVSFEEFLGNFHYSLLMLVAVSLTSRAGNSNQSPFYNYAFIIK